MRVAITLPQNAVPYENPHRNAELSSVPRVGDLIGYEDIDSYLVVKSVAWEIGRGSGPADIGHEPTIFCDWYYVED